MYFIFLLLLFVGISNCVVFNEESLVVTYEEQRGGVYPGNVGVQPSTKWEFGGGTPFSLAARYANKPNQQIFERRFDRSYLFLRLPRPDELKNCFPFTHRGIDMDIVYYYEINPFERIKSAPCDEHIDDFYRRIVWYLGAVPDVRNEAILRLWNEEHLLPFTNCIKNLILPNDNSVIVERIKVNDTRYAIKLTKPINEQRPLACPSTELTSRLYVEIINNLQVYEQITARTINQEIRDGGGIRHIPTSTTFGCHPTEESSVIYIANGKCKSIKEWSINSGTHITQSEYESLVNLSSDGDPFIVRNVVLRPNEKITLVNARIPVLYNGYLYTKPYGFGYAFHDMNCMHHVFYCFHTKRKSPLRNVVLLKERKGDVRRSYSHDPPYEVVQKSLIKKTINDTHYIYDPLYYNPGQRSPIFNGQCVVGPQYDIRHNRVRFNVFVTLIANQSTTDSSVELRELDPRNCLPESDEKWSRHDTKLHQLVWNSTEMSNEIFSSVLTNANKLYNNVEILEYPIKPRDSMELFVMDALNTCVDGDDGRMTTSLTINLTDPLLTSSTIYCSQLGRISDAVSGRTILTDYLLDETFDMMSRLRVLELLPHEQTNITVYEMHSDTNRYITIACGNYPPSWIKYPFVINSFPRIEMLNRISYKAYMRIEFIPNRVTFIGKQTFYQLSSPHYDPNWFNQSIPPIFSTSSSIPHLTIVVPKSVINFDLGFAECKFGNLQKFKSRVVDVSDKESKICTADNYELNVTIYDDRHITCSSTTNNALCTNPKLGMSTNGGSDVFNSSSCTSLSLFTDSSIRLRPFINCYQLNDALVEVLSVTSNTELTRTNVSCHVIEPNDNRLVRSVQTSPTMQTETYTKEPCYQLPRFFMPLLSSSYCESRNPDCDDQNTTLCDSCDFFVKLKLPIALRVKSSCVEIKGNFNFIASISIQSMFTQQEKLLFSMSISSNSTFEQSYGIVLLEALRFMLGANGARLFPNPSFVIVNFQITSRIYNVFELFFNEPSSSIGLRFLLNGREIGRTDLTPYLTYIHLKTNLLQTPTTPLYVTPSPRKQKLLIPVPAMIALVGLLCIVLISVCLFIGIKYNRQIGFFISKTCK